MTVIIGLDVTRQQCADLSSQERFRPTPKITLPSLKDFFWTDEQLVKGYGSREEQDRYARYEEAAKNSAKEIMGMDRLFVGLAKQHIGTYRKVVAIVVSAKVWELRFANYSLNRSVEKVLADYFQIPIWATHDDGHFEIVME